MTVFICRSVEQQFDDDVCAWHTEAQKEIRYWRTRTALQYPWPLRQRKEKLWRCVETLCERAINGERNLRHEIIRAQINALN